MSPKRALFDALISGFDRKSLEILFQIDLDTRLETISSQSDDLSTTVLKVIAHAYRTEQTVALIRAAKHANPTNSKVQGLDEREYGVNTAKQPPPKESSLPEREMPQLNHGQLDGLSIGEFVQLILSSMPTPYTDDVVDQLFLQIEHTPALLAQYKRLVQEASASTAKPSGHVNKQIGKAVKAKLGWIVIKSGCKSKNSLTKTFTRLAPND